jgi:adenine-specific DNA methylase
MVSRDGGDASGSQVGASRARKVNGVYYTPPRLAALLAGWALEREPKRVLEPSYGDGVFLREAEAKLMEHGVRSPGKRLYGVEIDPAGPTRLRKSGLRLPEGHLYAADLLSLDAAQLGEPFEAILGNPPYIRHHLLDEKLVTRGRESAKRLGIKLNGRSDAWAYFCAHLVTFLASGGRMALVLPGSVLQADYARPLLDALAREEGEVQLVRIGQRLFEGVQERTVLLLIDRSRPGGDPVIHRSIANLKGLGEALKRRPKARSSKQAERAGDSEAFRSRWGLSAKEAAEWEEACATDGVIRLGELAKIRIGVVTGANSFFVRSVGEAEGLGRRVRSAPIVSRAAWLTGPRWSSADQANADEKPSRLLLFPRGEAGLSRAARETIATGEAEALDERYHCEKRDPWYSIADAAVPELFLPYMSSEAPRLTINDARATCTNTIHRIWLDRPTSAEALAVASWTTLYRLSAELVGRTYGGGVLKLEPSGVGALRVAVVGDGELVTELEEALRRGGAREASALADRRVLIEGLGMSAAAVKRLASATDTLRQARRR